MRAARRRRLPAAPPPPVPVDRRAELDASGLPEPPTLDTAEQLRAERRKRLPAVPGFGSGHVESSAGDDAIAALPSDAASMGRRTRRRKAASILELSETQFEERMEAAKAALEGQASPTEPGDVLPTESGADIEDEASDHGAAISVASTGTRRGKRSAAAKKRRSQTSKATKKRSSMARSSKD